MSDACEVHSKPFSQQRRNTEFRGIAVSGGNVAVRLTGGTGTGERSQVLLRIEQQTHKLDTWAAGALLAALLTGRYPFFDGGADDQAALMEFVALFGAAKVRCSQQCVSMERRQRTHRSSVHSPSLPLFPTQPARVSLVQLSLHLDMAGATVKMPRQGDA